MAGIFWFYVHVAILYMYKSMYNVHVHVGVYTDDAQPSDQHPFVVRPYKISLWGLLRHIHAWGIHHGG